MLDITKISSPVMSDLMDICDGSTEDKFNCNSKNKARLRVANMSLEDAFDAWLKYQGIIGYTSPIMRTLKNLQEAEVK